MQHILSSYSSFFSMPYFDPLFKQTVKSLDALTTDDISHIGYEPVDETPNTPYRASHTQCVITCRNPPILRTPLSFDWPLHLVVVGQVSTVGPKVQETGARGVLPATAAGLCVEARHDVASRIQWQQIRDVLQSLSESDQFPLVEELDTSALYSIDEASGQLRMLVHADTEVTHGFPVLDGDGDHINLEDVSQVPHGVALRVVFRLECNKKPGDHARYLLHAPISYVAYA